MLIKTFGTFTERPKVLYLHGLRSTPEKDHVDSIKGFEIISPTFKYEVKPLFDDLCELISKDKIQAIGGYLAFHLANCLKIKALVFNPAFGDKRIEKIQPVKNCELFKQQIAVVGMSDNVINPNTQIKSLSGIDHIYKESSDHKINREILSKYSEIFLGYIKDN